MSEVEEMAEHMTKTEAHPYHQGRGCAVYDPTCPKCRDEPNDTTYVSWSLHVASMRKLAERFELLRGSYASMVATAEDRDSQCIRAGQRDGMREAAEIVRRIVADLEGT